MYLKDSGLWKNAVPHGFSGAHCSVVRGHQGDKGLKGLRD
jgi:hypothetical protein